MKGLRNNAEFQMLGGVPYVVATRRIEAGGEILVSYGDDYWDSHQPPDDGAVPQPKRARRPSKKQPSGEATKRGSKRERPSKRQRKQGEQQGKRVPGSAKKGAKAKRPVAGRW